MPYDEQLRFKQEQVAEQLKRIGGIELPEIGPIRGSRQTLFYRNKLEFTFSDRRWLTPEEIAAQDEPAREPALGFHIPGLFDKVLDIRKCWLQPDPSNAIRQEVRAFCIDRGYSFYGIREHRGLMRNLIVRTASTGEVMAIVVFGEDDRERIDALLSHTRERFPGLASLMWVVNTKLNDTIGDLEIRLHSGRDHIFEEMESLRFKVGPKSFYQTNSSQAYELYKIVREFAALTGQETVYDLYTGTGTIANFVAARASRVIGVEYVPEAIEDARTNSRLNGIDNTTFYGRHEGRARRGVRRTQRSARRRDSGPAPGRDPRGRRAHDPRRSARTDRLRQLQPGHAGPRLGVARCRLSRAPHSAGGYVPAHPPRKRRAAGPERPVGERSRTRLTKHRRGPSFRKQHGGKPFFPVVARLLPNSREAGFAETVERYAEASGKTFRPTQNDRPPRRQAKRCNIPEAGSI